MKTKITVIMVAVLFLGIPLAQATDYLVEDGDDYSAIDIGSGDTLLMTGGRIGGLSAYETSTATILNTDPMGPMTAGIHCLDAYGSSIINFSGGSIWYFEGFDSSEISIDGGEIQYLTMNESSTAHLSGGQILTTIGIRDDTSYTHIYGYGFSYDQYGGNYNNGLVTGYWQTGEWFEISLNNMHPSIVVTHDQLIFHIIPEPASFLLLGIGGLVLRKKVNG